MAENLETIVTALAVRARAASLVLAVSPTAARNAALSALPTGSTARTTSCWPPTGRTWPPPWATVSGPRRSTA